MKTRHSVAAASPFPQSASAAWGCPIFTVIATTTSPLQPFIARSTLLMNSANLIPGSVAKQLHPELRASVSIFVAVEFI